ncbi:ATP-dependent RNA helicase HrpA [Gallaecimonas kandeliae]|uniref:ATP-dependent RNA helicase HrpA n=1 Tax=Gallaecimonas kandeliae TaxID=3029055 RepID=UPI0026477C54|nr:ATP-dependent RNA helicase HrpA [Gallaecimonas kandeliae]WKE66813.1 ATP-dependent RNA helicase HrpA [Gallaecimonas kandeliae]
MSDNALYQALNDVPSLDRSRLRRRLEGAFKIKDEQKRNATLAMLQKELDKAKERLAARKNRRLHLDYPAQLPVVAAREDIKKAIAANQVVIIAGETGSGKTTQLPKICLELGRGIDGLIGHTQPRRLAARAVATRLAEELQTELGALVGYQVRFTDHTRADTCVKLMTDGILLAEIQKDKLLRRYDTLIIDEAHERSLNIDFLLGYLKTILPKRPDLKVIITSATIDPERFSRHFNEAPMLEVSGRTYPVEVRYRPITEEEKDKDQLQAIFDAVDELYREGPRGDILIFMNGEREIRDTADALEKRKLRHTEVLPLFSRLSAAEQQRIFAPHGGRRIVLATNVAETSLTVPGIKYVIDPGTARISRYSYRTKVQRLPIEAVSQASANQRKGRCGRTEPGICIRLYSEEDFLGRPEFTEPEILRTNLGAVILQMLSLGLGDIEAFPFVEAPDSRFVKDGLNLLDELGAIDGRALTDIGRQLAKLPVDTRLARCLVEGAKNGSLKELLIISAALAIQDPRERPLDAKQKADELHRRFAHPESDFQALVNLWAYSEAQQQALSGNQWRRLCQKEFLNYVRMREWQDLVEQLREFCEELGFKENSEPATYEAIHQALLAGHLSNIGFKDKDREYLGARQSRFLPFPGSTIDKKPKWLMAAELTETSRLFARTLARIEPEWAEQLAGERVSRSYFEPHWEKSRANVVAYEQVSLYGLVLIPRRRIDFGRVNPVEARVLFIRSALVEGDFRCALPFYKHNQQLIKSLSALEDKSRRRDILIEDDRLFDLYDARLPQSVFDGRTLDHWWRRTDEAARKALFFTEADLLAQDKDHVTQNAFPDSWAQGNLRLALKYRFEPGQDDDGVTVQIPLAALNQVEPTGFDWQVPGLREELVIALIKGLPKPVRRNFVPAPNYAQAALGRMAPLDGRLIDKLADALRQITGTRTELELWEQSSIPEHLRMRFAILDDKGKVLAAGRDLLALKAKLQGAVQETLSQVASPGIEKDQLTEWSFGALPELFVEKRQGLEVRAYPALVDDKDSVSVKLFDSPAAQADAQARGLRRLLLLNVPSPIKHLQDSLPNKAKLGLYFNPFGKVSDLIDDCIQAAVDQLITGSDCRDAAAFTALKDKVRSELNDTVVLIATQVEQILVRHNGIRKRLKGKTDLTMVRAQADIQAQLDALVFRGFVTETGAGRLKDVIRYLDAIERRLEKLPIDPNRDRLHLAKVESVAERWQQLRAKVPKGQGLPPWLAEARWMLEELRVSYFAQQLGTPYPISDKRILNFMEEKAKGG